MFVAGPNKVITIDGPAGCGKSTAAAALAKALGFLHLDTGATYRAAALKSVREGLSPRWASALARMARRADIDLVMGPRRATRVWLDGRDATRYIRTEEISARASQIAAIPAVRRALVAKQRRIGRRGEGVVAEGRDVGTVVFPHAAWKFYLTASVEARVRRRWRDLRRAGEAVSYSKVKQQVRMRDRRDATRKASPLRRARGAWLVDTTHRSAAGTLQLLLRYLKRHPVW